MPQQNNRYKSSCVFIVTMALTFMVLWGMGDLLFQAGFSLWDHYFKLNNPVSRKYGGILQKAYPEYSASEINGLLNEIWTLRLGTLEVPMAVRENAFQGHWVNVDPHGFRHGVIPSPWPPDAHAFNIFVFGGSTTFGYGVKDSDTIPSFLGEIYRGVHPDKKIVVYNFGRGGYCSFQEREAFESLLWYGYIPQMAIFIDGLNDFEYPIEDLKNNPETRALLSGNAFSQIGLGLRHLFFQKAIQRFVSSIRAGMIGAMVFGGKTLHVQEALSSHDAEEVILHYQNNCRMIDAISRAYKIAAVFVWQPIPYYKYDLTYNPMGQISPARRAEFGYPITKKRLFSQREGWTKNLFWAADIQEELHLTEGLYVDNVHYSAKMAKLIAQQIFQFISRRRLLHVDSNV